MHEQDDRHLKVRNAVKVCSPSMDDAMDISPNLTHTFKEYY